MRLDTGVHRSSRGEPAADVVPPNQAGGAGAALSCTFCVVDQAGKTVRQEVVETNGKALLSYLQQLAGELHLCLKESESVIRTHGGVGEGALWSAPSPPTRTTECGRIS